MPENNLYWPVSLGYTAEHLGAVLGLRADIAFRIIVHWGGVAGKGRTDPGSNDHRCLDLQTNEEFVARAFAIADLFVNTAESRGEIKPYTAPADPYGLPTLGARLGAERAKKEED